MTNLKKGKNTFLVYQEAKQRDRELLVRAFLNASRKSRVRYDYVTDLAKMVAAHIAETQLTECHYATLLRNKRYKSLLLSYMAEAPIGVRRLECSDVDEASASKSALTLLKLEASNLQQENSRLKAHIFALESDQAAVSVNKLEERKGDDAAVMELELFREKYIRTCQALQVLLDNLADIFALDPEEMKILDRSNRGKTVVDSLLAKPFFEWRAKHLSKGA